MMVKRWRKRRMKVQMKPKNVAAFSRAVHVIKRIVVGKENGFSWIYETNKGKYIFMKGFEDNYPYVEFDGKRRSFGTSPYFRVRRVKRFIGDDKIKMLVGNEEFEMEIIKVESSAPNKPFWATCSKSDYRALQKLKAF